MNPSNKKDALKLFASFKKEVKKNKSAKVKNSFILAPPVIYLDTIKSKIKDTAIELSGQDIFYENSGAFTGAISPLMLKDLGLEYSIVGHWERRNIFAESDQDIAKKVKSLLDLKMKAIVCVGERERDDQGDFVDSLEKQIINSLGEIENSELKNIIIAYEPVWTIGAGGKKINVEILEQTIILIQKILYKKFGENSKKIKIIYGGSVDDENILEYNRLRSIDGFLIGRAGLEVGVFRKMIELLS